MNTQFMSECVDRGIAKLSARDKNWPHQINLGTLDQESVQACVLSHIFGAYTDGLHALFGHLGGDTAENHGFMAGGKMMGTNGQPNSEPLYKETNRVLTNIWRQKILLLRRQLPYSSTPKATLQRTYLDWVNDFLTEEKFAEHYGLTVEQAKQLIALGRSVHEAIVAGDILPAD